MYLFFNHNYMVFTIMMELFIFDPEGFFFKKGVALVWLFFKVCPFCCPILAKQASNVTHE